MNYLRKDGYLWLRMGPVVDNQIPPPVDGSASSKGKGYTAEDNALIVNLKDWKAFVAKDCYTLSQKNADGPASSILYCWFNYGPYHEA